jgi:MFS transporter, DHA1 family, multidrug resistance protein
VLLLLACWRYLPETVRGRQEFDEGGRPSVRAGLRALVAHGAGARHVLTVCFVYAGMFAYIGGSPFVLMDVFGVAEQNFGYYFAVTAGGLFVSATLNRALLKRHASPVNILSRGVLVVCAAGFCLLLAVWFGVGGLSGVLVPMTAYMFGQGLVMPNATAAAMAPHGRSAGVVSSVMGCLQTGGAALSGYLVGLFYDHTPLSLALTVAAFAGLTLLAAAPTAFRSAHVDEMGADTAQVSEI